MNWQDILKIRPRKRKRQADPPNVFAGETNEGNPRRIMGRGVMRDLQTGEEVDSTRGNTPRAKRHTEKAKESRKKVSERLTRPGVRFAQPGDTTGFGKNPRIGPKTAKKATKTFPRNRCARCGRMLSARKRNDIIVDGKKLNLSFCDECAADMVKE
jgi:ribosomal protein L44E|tara:strand:+ start:365 stop:832 length:468 start_codon:yes stop_codon:yes gene_type:complete